MTSFLTNVRRGGGGGVHFHFFWSPLEIHLPNIYYSPGLVANCVMFTLDSRSTVTSYVEAALVNIVLQ